MFAGVLKPTRTTRVPMSATVGVQPNWTADGLATVPPMAGVKVEPTGAPD